MAQPTVRNPLPRIQTWFDEAEASGQRNPLAMALSTASKVGRPSVRYVLVKHLSIQEGFLVFYTNYGSRKAQELDANAFAAGAMYWGSLGRQLRFEGSIVRSPAEESDRYFASRPRPSQLSAWASKQSCVLGDADELDQRLKKYERQFAAGELISRPPFWGGYRLWLDAIELWTEGVNRFHDRSRYERTLISTDGAQFESDAWQHCALQP